MFNPQIYSNNNCCQMIDVMYITENYLKLINWGTEDKVLDIGCGDGNILVNGLLPKIPDNSVTKVIGVDISEEMIKFAKNSHKDSRVRFAVMDITTKTIPVDFKEEFHHVFSFFCLHWVSEHRQVMINIFDMLKPGGDLFLAFLVKNPIYGVYKIMEKYSKWVPYLQKKNRYLTPYQHSKDADEVLENLLVEVGFVNRLHKIEERVYDFPNFSAFRDFFIAVNPIAADLPSSEKDEFLEDCMKEIMKQDFVTVEGKFQVIYDVFIVHSIKPL